MMAVNDAKDRVRQLENAINRLDAVRKHLNRNASDIKADIHASVSRNLEYLRGREVSLMRQVDHVQGLKEETLQQQQARLNQALGILKTGLSMILEDAASHKQLSETLRKLDSVELSPEETPYISFRADHYSLRESILNYGRVDANGLPLITAFDDPGNPSASLPRHVEEYEDVDHHFFYKTLEEVTKSQQAGTCITVTIPRLNAHMEECIYKKMLYNKPEPERPTVRCDMAVRPSTLTKAVDGATPGGSLDSWLNILKQHVDQEEEHDFEIVDRSTPVQAASTCAPIEAASVPLFLKPWLLPQSGAKEEMKSDFFKHIPKDNKLWLQQFQQQVSNIADLQSKDMCSHISKEPSSWLRSRVLGKNASADQTAHDLFSHITRDKSCWLASEKKPTRVEVKVDNAKQCIQDLDHWLMPKQKDIKPSLVKEKLAKTSGQSSIFKPLDLPLNSWLSINSRQLDSVTQKCSTEQKSGSVHNTCDYIWLQLPSKLPKVLPGARDGHQQVKPGAVVDTCLSDWQLVLDEDMTTPAVAGGGSDSSDGWSICSDVAVTNEKLAQDVAATNEYLSKWVM